MKILIICSSSRSLINFRYNLLVRLRSLDISVKALIPPDAFSEEVCVRLSQIGVEVGLIKLKRRRFSPFTDLLSILEIYSAARSFGPKKIFAYTAKPIIFGSLVSVILKKPMMYSMITGLGLARSINVKKISTRLLIKLLHILMKISFKFNENLIFQNAEDVDFCRRARILDCRQKVSVVNGSGVDLTHFEFRDAPESNMFLFMARLIKEKGVIEFIEAANIVKKQNPEAQFCVAGAFEQGAISESEMSELCKSGAVEYVGGLTDVRDILQRCRYFVLPSYYGEGIPRSLLEALATGRPILTTDWPGCRETVIDGSNGFILPIRDSKRLAEAMLKCISLDNRSYNQMALKSYELAVNRFDVNLVNMQVLQALGLR